jgi:hypothetical protein
LPFCCLNCTSLYVCTIFLVCLGVGQWRSRSRNPVLQPGWRQMWWHLQYIFLPLNYMYLYASKDHGDHHLNTVQQTICTTQWGKWVWLPPKAYSVVWRPFCFWFTVKIQMKEESSKVGAESRCYLFYGLAEGRYWCYCWGGCRNSNDFYLFCQCHFELSTHISKVYVCTNFVLFGSWLMEIEKSSYTAWLKVDVIAPTVHILLACLWGSQRSVAHNVNEYNEENGFDSHQRHSDWQCRHHFFFCSPCFGFYCFELYLLPSATLRVYKSLWITVIASHL